MFVEFINGTWPRLEDVSLHNSIKSLYLSIHDSNRFFLWKLRASLTNRPINLYGNLTSREGNYEFYVLDNVRSKLEIRSFTLELTWHKDFESIRSVILEWILWILLALTRGHRNFFPSHVQSPRCALLLVLMSFVTKISLTGFHLDFRDFSIVFFCFHSYIY